MSRTFPLLMICKGKSVLITTFENMFFPYCILAPFFTFLSDLTVSFLLLNVLPLYVASCLSPIIIIACLKSSNSRNDDFILLLNDDVYFADNISIKNMLKLFNKDVGVVGARLLYPDSKILQHAGVIFGKRYGEMPYHYRHQEPDDKHSRKNNGHYKQ